MAIRKIHLSYDIKPGSKYSHDNIFGELVSFIKQLDVQSRIIRPVESTIVFESTVDFVEIDKRFKEKFTNEIFFVFTLVALTKNKNNELIEKFSINSNKVLEHNFDIEFNSKNR